jgi:sugar/nucleoside kinase (ribokinase family)
VDSDQQPRFIYSPGANSQLDQDILDRDSFLNAGIRFLHTAGYFVLPGLLNPAFGIALKEIQDAGIFTSLDVVRSPAMKSPDPLWGVLPYLDLFTCNQGEARILSGCQEPDSAAAFFHQQGARRVIIKLGAEGCWLSDGTMSERIPAPGVAKVLDTTGAGDAFAAGLLAALREGQDLVSACQAGNQKGAQATQFLGAVKLDSSQE